MGRRGAESAPVHEGRTPEVVDRRSILTPEMLSIGRATEKGDKILDDKGQLRRMPHLEGKVWQIPVDFITENPDQPRQYFDEGKMAEITASMSANGQLMPIQVDPFQEGRKTQAGLFLIDGARRLRGAKELGWKFVKGVVVWEPSARAILKKSTILNIREENNAMEMARAFERLVSWKMEEDGVAKTEAIKRVATDIGFSKNTITNYLRLLTLHEDVQEAILTKNLPPYGTLQIASAAVKFGDRLDQARLARLIVDNPDKTFEVGREGTLTARGIREAVHATLAASGDVTAEERATLEAQRDVVAFVSSLRGMTGRTRRVLDANPKIVIDTLRNRPGFPPDKVFEGLETLTDLLQRFFSERVKAAMSPEPLVVPKGAPKFSEHVGRRKAVFASELRFAIAQVLARASDDQGQVLTARRLTKTLEESGVKGADITAVTNNLRYLAEELEKMDLSLDIHTVRRRAARNAPLEKVPGYRLAWDREVSFTK